jgi:hypothetical protein
MADQYFGKYSGIVKDNRDDDKLGRIMVSVPAIFDPDETVRARPVLPYGVFFVPEKDTGVWVEFEGGDPNLPLWVGVQPAPGAFADAQSASPPTIRAVSTVSGHLLVFDDTSGSEAIVLTDGAHQHVLSLDGDGVTVQEGQSGNKITISSDSVVIEQCSGHKISLESGTVSVSHQAGNSVTVDATSVKAATSASSIELGPAGVTITGTPLLKLNTGAAPVVRAGIDQGIGNMGAPVVMLPGQFTVLA